MLEPHRLSESNPKLKPSTEQNLSSSNYKIEDDLQAVMNLISNSRNRALARVNEELVRLYWSIGKHISERLSSASYGDAYVNKLADSISRRFPGIKGYNRRGLYRMRQFYELYCNDENVSTLLTHLSWSQHLLLMSGCKSQDERRFYMQKAIEGHYSFRDLERQIDSALFERRQLSNSAPSSTNVTNEIRSQFMDRILSTYYSSIVVFAA